MRIDGRGEFVITSFYKQKQHSLCIHPIGHQDLHQSSLLCFQPPRGRPDHPCFPDTRAEERRVCLWGGLLMAQCVFPSMPPEVFHFQALKQKLMFCALKTQLLQLPCVTDLLSKHDLTWPHSKAPSSSELSPYRPFLHLLPLLIFVSSLVYLCQKYFLILFSSINTPPNPRFQQQKRNTWLYLGTRRAVSEMWKACKIQAPMFLGIWFYIVSPGNPFKIRTFYILC